MKKIILAITLLALAGTQVQTASAHGWGRGGFGWGVGVGVLGGLAVGTAIGEAYARPVYYDSYYYYGRPYYGSRYYYPTASYYNYSVPAQMTTQPAQAPAAAPQNITINNNYYNTSTPMTGANSLFGR
jgi:hypothetical protein